MAFEDINTQGSKGTNGPWQRAVLKLLKAISLSGGGGGGGALNTASKGVTPVGNPTSRSKSANVTALDVQIVDASGNQITAFGGGSTTPLTVPTALLVVTSGSVSGGASWINFTTSFDFDGTINGQSFPAGYAFLMPVVGSRPYPAIFYTIVSGNIRIDTAI